MEYSCFTILFYFLLHSKANQLYVCMHLLSLRHPPPDLFRSPQNTGLSALHCVGGSHCFSHGSAYYFFFPNIFLSVCSSGTQIAHSSVYLKLFHRLSLFLWFLLSILPSLFNVNSFYWQCLQVHQSWFYKMQCVIYPQIPLFFISFIIIFIAGNSFWVSYNLFYTSLNMYHIPQYLCMSSSLLFFTIS